MKGKITALLLASTMALGACTGCSGKSTKSDTTTKQYTISVFTTRVQPEANSQIMQKIEQKLGQKIEVTAVDDTDYATKLNLYIASQQMPDIYQATFTADGSTNAMKASATLTESDLKTYMPDTYKTFTNRLKTYSYDKSNVFSGWSVNGKLKCFGSGSVGNYTPFALVINTTMLKDLGLSTPKTIDDWTAAFKAYKAKYPAKYPLTARGKSSPPQSFYMFYAAYGLTWGTWELSDNKLTYSLAMPQWKECLTQLADWYKAGYINPEWFTMDTQAYNNEFINGNTFVSQYYNINNEIDPPYDAGTLLAQAVAKNSNAQFAFCPFPTWKSGVKPVVTNYNLFGTGNVSFGGQLEKNKDKLHAAMKVWDELMNDKEIYMLRTYGIEGTTYDIKNGVPVIRQQYTTNDAKSKIGFGWPTAGGYEPTDEVANSVKPSYALENYKKLIGDANGYMGKNMVDYGFSRVTGSLVTDAGVNLDSKNTSYDTQWSTLFTSIIIGQKPVSAYDDFVAQWKKDVGNDMTALANQKYLKQWIK